MSARDGGPAFPRPYTTDGMAEDGPEPGMSLRDYFAGQALLGLLAGDDPDAPWAMRELPKLAYRLADDMLAARSPREEEPSDDE